MKTGIVYLKHTKSPSPDKHQAGMIAGDAAVPARETGFPNFTLACLMKNETEVDATIKKAKTLGLRILKPGQKTYRSGYSGYFAVLHGFLREIV